MCEMRGRVAHGDLFRHAQPIQNMRLHRHHIRRGLATMKGQIHQSRGNVFHSCKSLIEIRGTQNLFQHLSGHRSTRFRMSGKLSQNLGHLQPVFVQLAWQFDKIPRHGRPRNAFISHVRQHLVQRMTELVEQRARIVIGQQRRLALGKIAYVDHDGRLHFGELRLRPHCRAPSP